jgi:hypothetical protein
MFFQRWVRSLYCTVQLLTLCSRPIQCLWFQPLGTPFRPSGQSPFVVRVINTGSVCQLEVPPIVRSSCLLPSMKRRGGSRNSRRTMWICASREKMRKTFSSLSRGSFDVKDIFVPYSCIHVERGVGCITPKIQASLSYEVIIHGKSIHFIS